MNYRHINFCNRSDRLWFNDSDSSFYEYHDGQCGGADLNSSAEENAKAANRIQETVRLTYQTARILLGGQSRWKSHRGE